MFKNLFHELLGKNFDTPRHIFVKKPRECLTPPKAKNDWPKIFIVLKFKSWLPVINYAKSQKRQNLLALELSELFSLKVVGEIFTIWGRERSP